MNDGTAKAWKEAYVGDAMKSDPPKFGTATNFFKDLQKAFSVSDAEGDARAGLRQLRQGKDSVDEYIAQFRILAR